ncbi:inhibitor of apoptosis-promoting Bax1-domain-containing protein [Peziza echinospora]|nr:inhibitor of apoptosis-promoting Bax1-domain-containing protein [Peziza echinospora]
MASARILSTAFCRPQAFSKLSTPVARSFNKFHTLPKRSFRPIPNISLKIPKRTFTTDPAIHQRPDRDTSIRKLLYAGALFGGALLGTQLMFNTPSREAALHPEDRSYLNQTFAYTGAGVMIIGVASKLAHNAGWSYRLMAMNPWLVMGGGLALSLGTMFATRATNPDNTFAKHAWWTAFNVSQAFVLAPTFFYAPALIARAGLYTVGVMGSMALVGSTAREDKFLYLGGPLLAGVAVVALSGLAPLVLPVGTRALAWTESISLYGGLAVFTGFTLYDVQKILAHARYARQGLMKKDVVNESIALELDFINIFIRLLTILGRNDRKR